MKQVTCQRPVNVRLYTVDFFGWSHSGWLITRHDVDIVCSGLGPHEMLCWWGDDLIEAQFFAL